MLVYLIKSNEITSLRLPNKIQGNYFISYNKKGKQINLINIKAEDNRWIISSNVDVRIIQNNQTMQKETLREYNFYELLAYNTEKMYLYVMPLWDETYRKYTFFKNQEIRIGKSQECNIYYPSPAVNNVHAHITNENGLSVLYNTDETFGTYINNKKIERQILKTGDIIFIMGLKIIYMDNFLVINNPYNNLQLDSKMFTPLVINEPQTNTKEDPYLTSDEEYFEKMPRFITKFKPEEVIIDAPPTPKGIDDKPLIYTLGPMLTMSMMSIVTVFNAISNMVTTQNYSQSFSTLIIGLAMLASVIVWPSLSRKYQKKLDKEEENERQEKYKKYLEEKSNKIQALIDKERQTIIENNPSIDECVNILINKKRNLFEREITNEDFLTVRLGLGNKKPNIKINYPEEHFTMEEDNLKDLLNSIIISKKYIKNVPITTSLYQKNVTAILGNETNTNQFIDSILLQVMTLHSYRDLKIIYLSSKQNDHFTYLKLSPHLLNDDKTIRFYGDNPDDIKIISTYLSNVYNYRKSEYKENLFIPYYLILIDDIDVLKNASIIKEITASKINYGFSVLYQSPNLSSVPKECKCFINIDGKTSGIFENELISDKEQEFTHEMNTLNHINMNNAISIIAQIPLKTKDSANFPKTLGFLEMYDVGNIGQLNILNRWRENDPTHTLSVPVGLDENGEQFKLDLHEKMHGPHGLIAGMTGSGKSEFIITYILSLAINYHPKEVSFALIDYKGGGLAGAFENKEKGIKLPHLIGTITNLDNSEINRCLSSIRSELRRRQKKFNEARNKLGESTIDIYKYQKYYREGKLDEQISHLFIISDEFAELKTQRPEFMKELISTARIGRSLGVHLILATQKPHGVVDDQIWSNSRFRICLKVQDKADSRGMIQTDAAALLTDVGRFYLQVGYNEYFAEGQSAYSGCSYYPKEKLEKKANQDIIFVDNVGAQIKSVTDITNAEIPISEGEEITNIVKYISTLAKEENITTKQLWLEKLKEKIYVSDIINKYGYRTSKNLINPIIGEYDDPENQTQGPVNLNIDGNTLIIGSSESGKEDLLNTIIYSTIIRHKTEEVNFYLLDFGSENLRMFQNAPQIGDFITIEEKEKVNNLFKMLKQKIEERKKILHNYNGDINLYREKNNLENIVVIINNYEVFSETYDMFETLVSLTRDCNKYGIYFILTATSSNIRSRLLQNFEKLIPLRMNDKYEYTGIIGKTDVIPSDIKGRGLIKINNNIYEFQTAYTYDNENLLNYISNICKKLIEIDVKAPSIPVLPKKVTLNLFSNNDSKTPVGIACENLEKVRFDFKNNFTTIISANQTENLIPFLNPLSTILPNLYIFDPLGLVQNNSHYYKNNFDTVLSSLNEKITEYNKIYEENNYNLDVLKNIENITILIVDIETFFKRLKDKKLFEKLIENSLEINKITFILASGYTEFKTYEYEPWFKTSVNKASGIWVGNGLNEQTILKTGKIVNIAKSKIPNNYGFVLLQGDIKYVKLIEEW